MSLLKTVEKTQESLQDLGQQKYSQKYSLQRRDRRGFFERVATFDQTITPEETVEKFGPGYYILRATKPRFKTVWKQQVGENEQSKKLQTLDRRTKYIGAGLVGVALTEVVGFGLTHGRFCSAEERLDKVETALHTLKPDGLRCKNCGAPLDYLLQKFCGQCGTDLNWPRNYLPIISSSNTCLSCNLPVLSHQVFCTNCGQARQNQAQYQLKTAVEFRVVSMSG